MLSLLISGLVLWTGCELPATPPLPNACGGPAVLRLDDEAASPGAPCGPCADGVIACEGLDALTCVGATTPNVCGGCGALPGCAEGTCALLGAFNDACAGAWCCDEATGTRVCDRPAPNACGGQAALIPGDARPGWACQLDDGTGPREGTWSCVGPDAIRCILPAQNRCGGAQFLAGTPGEPCLTTACVPWRWECVEDEGEPFTRCAAPQEGGTNFCGGCQPLGVEVGSACGCGGQWVCDPDDLSRDRVVCDDPARNACGGCAALDAPPGTACPGGAWACLGLDAVQCAPQGRNGCGGDAPLERQPGASCGPCQDGRTVCVTPDAIACIGASAVNACGGCGFLQSEPGTGCGQGARWRCEGTLLRCLPDPDLNPCGGPAGAVAEGAVWSVCGEGCEAGRMSCAGPSEVRCVPGTPGLLFFPDRDSDGFGDRAAAATCQPAVGLVTDHTDCDDADPAIHPAAAERVGDAVDEDCDGVRLCYLDRDGDGFGDPFTAIAATRDDCTGAGQSDNGDDCDDRHDDAHPGHVEVCGDLRDNDCDLEGDEPDCVDP